MMLNKVPVCASIRYPELSIKSRRGVTKKGTIIVKSSEEVDLFWVSNSENKNFTLEYIPVKYVDCKKKIYESNVTIKYVVPDNFGTILFSNLSGLTPFVTYNFTILHENEGIILEQAIDMFPKETLEEEDLPIIQTKQDHFNLEISLSLFDCKKIQGQLFYILTVEGKDPWNEDIKTKTVTKRFYRGSMSHSYKILGYSTYNVTILFSRNENFLNNRLYHNFSILTAPTAPLPIPNITMYSKTVSSISLRWSKPYPPTGQLENYFIQYWVETRRQELRVAKIEIDSNCIFWPELICGEINNLKANENYTICVVGKNVNSTNLSECTNPINVVTKEDRPEAPLNFEIILHDLVMVVNFERPDKSYGRLIFCIITIAKRIFMFSIEGDDIKFFSMAMNVEEFSAKYITVGLQVTNLGGVSNPIYKTIKTPPKTPIIKRSAFVYLPKHAYEVFKYNCSDLNDEKIYHHTKLLHTELNKEDPKLSVALKDELIHEEITQTLVVVVRNSFDSEVRCVSKPFFLKLGHKTGSIKRLNVYDVRSDVIM
nr:uncharacterized protein LOC111425550 [Onthophagus taurus]